MDWTKQNGLDWSGLDWSGLERIGLEWIGLEWTKQNGLDWSGLGWIVLDDAEGSVNATIPRTNTMHMHSEFNNNQHNA